MKILVGISGASGVCLGFKLANILSNLNLNTHVVISQNAVITAKFENENLINLNPNIKTYENSEIYSPPASGSAKFDAMIISPCSTNSLAKIACGIGDTLLTRAAAVMLKEKKKLILCVREMPFSAISLGQMANLSNLGVVIAPPILGYYSKPQTIEDIENFIIGKWLDLLGINHNLYQSWGEKI